MGQVESEEVQCVFAITTGRQAEQWLDTGSFHLPLRDIQAFPNVFLKTRWQLTHTLWPCLPGFALENTWNCRMIIHSVSTTRQDNSGDATDRLGLQLNRETL